MKLLELIQLLQAEFDKHGDLPVFISHEWTEPFEQGDLRGVHYIPLRQDSIWPELPEMIDIS